MSNVSVRGHLIFTKDSPLMKQCMKPQLMYVKYTDYGLRRFKKNRALRSKFR